jgi:hypothetical protein
MDKKFKRYQVVGIPTIEFVNGVQITTLVPVMQLWDEDEQRWVTQPWSQFTPRKPHTSVYPQIFGDEQ